MQNVARNQSFGFGVRVLYKGTWEFAASHVVTPAEVKRVTEQAFDAILERIKAAGIPYRSNVHGLVDFQINTQQGGSIVYWNEPDGHQWEMLTVSYARQT